VADNLTTTGAADLAVAYSDLGFDITPHREAIGKLIDYGYDAPTIRATLTARDIIFVRVVNSRFRIDVWNDPSTLPNPAAFAGDVIFEASDAAQARQVREDVERYFLRHFPGRYVRPDMPAMEADDGATYVVITLFAPADEDQN
jgi:hypothetical protein